MKKLIVLILAAVFLLSAETLFQVKDSQDRIVLDVSTDGLRILNEGDTLMVISSGAIRANIGVTNKGLSRSFSVTTSTSKGKGLINALEVDAASATMTSPDGKYTDFSPDNIFLGLNSGISNTDGVSNIFLGNESGRNNTIGYENILIGDSVGISNVSGYKNVFIGNTAGYSNNSGYSNLFLGYSSGKLNYNGDRNISIGNQAGEFNVSGNDNISIGVGAGRNNTATLGVFIGSNAGVKNTSGTSNTFIGNQAGANNTTGGFNTYLGWYAGSHMNGNHNTMLGIFSGYGSYSGDYNVYLGEFAGRGNDGSNNVCIGYNTTVSGSGKLAIDNSNTTTPLIAGDFTTDALTVNGTFTSTGNATFASNAILNGTYFKINSNPGTGVTPTNYVYQGATGSTSKGYAFTVNDALWVTKNAFIDGNLTLKGGTAIGKTQAGSYTAGANSAGGVKTFTITFPTAFGTTPKVNVTPKGENFPDVFAVTTRNISTTSFQVNVYRVDIAGGIWGQNLKLDWYAWE